MSRTPCGLTRIVAAVALAVLATAGIAHGAQSRELTAAGRWSGAITLPAGELRIGVSLDERAGAWTGTIDIPAQNLSAMALADLRVPLEPLVEAIVFTKRPPARLTDAGFLKGLAGTYVMADNPEFRMAAMLTGNVLTLTIPGQEPRTLEPAFGTTFKLKGLTGFTVKFELDAQDRATVIKLSQPNGVYTLKRAVPSS